MGPRPRPPDLTGGHRVAEVPYLNHRDRGLAGSLKVARRPFDLFRVKKEVLPLHHSTGAVAALAPALNDANRSIIGDPRRGTYAVSFVTKDMDEARELASQLASLGLNVRTNVRRDELGEPTLAYVVLYDAADQRRLLEILESHLDSDRRQRLEDLVLARGSIPDDLLKRIWRASESLPWSADRIAEQMNRQGIIAGMGGIRWTAKKVQAALDEYERRTAEEEAGQRG